MTRDEYLKELDSHLISLPKEERDLAVRFYEEYFDEAGPENEQAVIEDLGKPFSLARSIIGETSLYSKSEVYLNYKASKPMPQNNASVFASLKKPEAFEQAEQPAPDTAEDIMPQNMPNQEQKGEYHEQSAAPEQNKGMFDDFYTHGNTESTPPPKQQKKPISGGWLAFWIILGVFVGIPLACGIIPAIFAILAAMFAVGISGAACVVGAVCAVIVGIVNIPSSIAFGLSCIAAGIFTAGIGFLMLSGALSFFFRLLPFIYKGIVKLCKRGDV